MDVDEALKAMAHPQRRAILRLVRGRERTAGEIAGRCGLSGPAASQHLKALRSAGLLRVRAEGTRRLYTADFAALGALRGYLDEIWDERLATLKDAVEAEQEGGRLHEAG